MYHSQIEEVADIEKSYQWLGRAGLKGSTEALTMAVQEQALSIRSVEAGIYQIRDDSRCRLCKDASETIQHITVGCKIQAGRGTWSATTTWLPSMGWKPSNQNERHLQRSWTVTKLRSYGTSRYRPTNIRRRQW